MTRSFRSVLLVAALLLALVGCAAALSGCAGDTGGGGVSGSGRVTSEDRPVTGVTSVALGTRGDLTIQIGAQESLRVEAEDNLLQYLKTTVSGGRLTIDEASGTDLRPTKPIHYVLTVKSLDSIETSSSGNVTAPALTAAHFAVAISGLGSVHLAALQADSLEVRLSSSGGLTIDGGRVGSQTIRLPSSGRYDAPNMASRSATVDLSSSGSATIWVTDRILGSVSSSGGLKYYGSPKVSVDLTSGGRVTRLGDK
jgi:hypothetical protein